MERLKEIWQKIKDFWMKFNKKQRTLIITISAVVILAIIILAIVFSRDKSVRLRVCVNEAEAVEVRTLLSDNGITGTIDSNNCIYVSESDYLEAKLVLGSNNISSDGYSFDDAISSSFTTTETVMKEKYIAYLCSKFENDLESMDAIKQARVNITYPETGNTLFAETQDASITAVLTLRKPLSDEQAEAIGMLLATNVGSDNTNSVFVVDSQSNVIYSGSTSKASSASNASQKVKAQFENAIISGIEGLLYQTGRYNDVQVMPNLDVNFDNVEIVDHEYTIPEGSEEGLKKHSYEVNSEGSIAEAGGTVGTESNDDDTTYMIENSDGGTSTYSLKEYEWLQNETITTTTKASGTINWDNSSIAIVAVKNTVLTEEEAEKQGYLADMTWEEFKAANSTSVNTEVPENIVEIVSMGSGVDEKNIAIISYDTFTFFDEEVSKSGNSWFVVQIILAVLIAGLLVFIIIRSTRPIAVEETEPELSVEDMLATTKQKQEPVEEIGLNDKSETRKAIEKFVDENPEAVALLLRNWLDKGWN